MKIYADRIILLSFYKRIAEQLNINRGEDCLLVIGS